MAPSPDHPPDRKQITTGWLYVVAQAILLVLLVALHSADHWPVPRWLGVTALVLIAAGLVLVVAAGLRLGPSLTPTPVPKEDGALITEGLYRFSRHPIYSGVLLAVAGVVIGSGNFVTLVVGLVTAAFFTIKARWEEQRLAERYPDYPAYAATTGRFGPRLRRH